VKRTLVEVWEYFTNDLAVGSTKDLCAGKVASEIAERCK
jgi:hypothetical protein